MDRVDVKPELLRWARERVGIPADALVERFPALDAWERGESKPTLKQLERFAKAMHTPIGFLFLSAPPIERMPIPDFRTMADRLVTRPSPDLLDTIYLCQQRQDWYRDFARTNGDAPRDFVASMSIHRDIVATAKTLRNALGFDLEERRRFATWTDALRRFIEQADALGVLVMVSGVVASNNRRRLDPAEFRGFALADEMAPLVFVNGADTKAAQMFTLAHEIAHIWLGKSGVSDPDARETSSEPVERWCNAVAAELLVPIEVLSREYVRRAEPRTEATRLAKRFKVSTLVILRRMHEAGGLTRAAFSKHYEEELEHLKGLPKGSGGDFYLTLGARAGKTFARALVSSTVEGRSSFSEALRLLGFSKMSTFKELASNLGVGF